VLAFKREAYAEIVAGAGIAAVQADVLFNALIIFVAPVAVVTEFLGKYRCMEQNLFQTNGEQASCSQVERRMAMRDASP